MALTPLASFPPGCSTHCSRSVIARGDAFAVCSAQSVTLYRNVTRSLPGDILSDAGGGNESVSPSTTTPRTSSITHYAPACVYGHGVGSTIASFDYNDDCLVCVTPQSRLVLRWALADAEPRKLPASLMTLLQREGAATAVCLVGKHHLVVGTTQGRLISLNMNEGNEPRSIAVPAAVARKSDTATAIPAIAPGDSSVLSSSYPILSVPARNGASSPPLDTSVGDGKGGGGGGAVVGRVTCLAVSPARADVLACGTGDGTLCLLTLHPSSGLHVTASLLPFVAPALGVSAAKEERKAAAMQSASATTAADAPSVTALAFSPTTAHHLLVVSCAGALALCDTNAHTTLQLFDCRESPKLSGVAWSTTEATTFYTVGLCSTRVERWQTGSKTRLASYPSGLDAAGLSSVACLEKNRLVVGSLNGAVRVFDPESRHIEFDIEAGHTDALLGCRMSRHDKDLIASCGVDGGIRVWSVRGMSLLFRIDVGPTMVYAVDWSGNGKHLVAALGSGEVVVYACSTRREVWRVAVFPDLVFRVLWSSEDASLIIAASRASLALLSAKDGRVLRRYGGGGGNGAIYAMDLEPTKGRLLATGCSDGKIYLYNVTSALGEGPTLVLAGHGGAVYDVAFCSTAPQFLLTCSDDATVRVWDLDLGDPHTIAVNARVLKGHTDKVRSVAWCSIAPYLVLSGSADATVRLWDIRNGVTVSFLREHNADVFALGSHPERPLIFFSAARDGQLVLWGLTLLRQLYLDAALGTLDAALVPEAAAVMAITAGEVSVSAIAGPAAQRLVHELRELSKPVARLQRLVDFFELPCGALDVAQLAGFASDAATYVVDTRALVVPPAKLLDARRARAKQSTERAHGRTAAAAGRAFRKARLLEAADELLRVGQVEEYCNTLLEAEEWDRAVAMAPMLGKERWRGVCMKAAEALEAAGEGGRAMAYFLLAQERGRAVRLCAQQTPQLAGCDAGLALCQQLAQGALAAAQVVEMGGGTAGGGEEVGKLQQGLTQERIAALASYGNPRLIAAALLASGHNDEAVHVLQVNGDVVLAHLLVHAVPLREQASIDAAFRMSMLQSARQRKWETALLCASRVSNPYDSLATLLAYFHYVQNKLQSSNSGTAQLVAERSKSFGALMRQECQKLQLPLDSAAIQQRHANDGLASQNIVAAMVIGAEGGDVGAGATSAAIFQSVNGFIEGLLSAALQDIDGVNAQFYLKQAWNVSGYVSLSYIPANAAKGGTTGEAAGTGAPQNAPQHSVDERKFLALAFMLAALMTVKVYRFPKLLNPAFAKARELARGHPSVEALCSKMQSVLTTYSPHSIEVSCAPLGSLLPVLGSDGRLIASSLTGEPVHGSLHVLEDGVSVLSKGEALAWCMCCHFSHLATGARMVVL